MASINRFGCRNVSSTSFNLLRMWRSAYQSIDRSFRSFTGRSIDQSIEHAIRQISCRYGYMYVCVRIFSFKQIIQPKKPATKKLLVASLLCLYVHLYYTKYTHPGFKKTAYINAFYTRLKTPTRKNRRVFNAVSLSRLKRLDVLNSLKLISFLFLFNLYFHITLRKRNRWKNPF